MEQLKSLFSRKAVAVSVATGVAVAAQGAFAAGDIDTTEALAYVAGGVVAAAAITAAMMGLVALIGAAKKAMRAGT